LNSLRLIGTEEGAYRYADPNEDENILSGKINGILDVITKSSLVPITILPESNLKVISGMSSPDGKFWVDLTNESYEYYKPVVFSVDNGEPISVLPVRIESIDLWSEWYSKLIHDIAFELLVLARNNQVTTSDNLDPTLARELHLELLLLRSNAIICRLEPSSVNHHRLTALLETLNNLRKGETINELKLNDMKFEGKFATKFTSSAHVSTPSVTISPPKQTTWPIYKYENKRRLSAKETEHRIFIILGRSNNHDVINWIHDDILNQKQNGANILHIVASIGRIALIPSILESGLNINEPDSKGRTPLDLSVLYGYWKMFDSLQEKGGKLSLEGQLLLRTCISKGYYELASRLVKHSLAVITDDMLDNVPTAEGLKWLSVHSTKNLPLETAILKGALDIVTDKIASKSKISWLGLEKIFTKSTQDYVSIVRLLLDSKKAQSHEIIPISDSAGAGVSVTLLPTAKLHGHYLFQVRRDLFQW